MAGTAATIKPTPAEILTAIKTVDGAGSGLDADTLDSVNGAGYETAGAAATHAALTAAHGATGAVVGETNSQTLTNKTLTTPTIASFTNAQHNHQNAAGGGQLDHGAALTGLSDDDHTIYALLAGRSGGQSLSGGIAANDDLTLQGTTNGTRTTSYVNLQPNGGNVGVGLTAPTAKLQVAADAVASTAEDVARFGVSDDTTGYLKVVNGTTGDNSFSATLEGLQAAAAVALLLLAKATTDTGAVPVMIHDSRLAAGGAVATRPTHDFRNNGTSQLIILANGNVGIGNITSPGSLLSVRAGTSTDFAAVGGTLYFTTAQTGNVGTGEDDLASFTVPANTLAVNGDSIWFEASGTAANNANAKTLRARFGSSGTSQIFSQALTVNQAGQWVLRGRVIRTGSATQKGYAGLSGNQNNTANVVTNLNQTLSNAIAIRITGEATSNNDIVLETFVVGYNPNNT